MFGHQDDQSQDTTTDAVMPPADLLNDVADSSSTSQTDVPSPIDFNPAASPSVGAPADIISPDPTPAPVDDTPEEPKLDAQPTSSSDSAMPADSPSDDTAPSADDASTDDLLSIKLSALQDLSPLVDHLDQTPEEKFRTTMMMIQAADDKTLVKSAYEAAQQITDDKVKAQALLDIVNEINYFTQHQS